MNTACYVDGEIIAYQEAILNAANKYWLNYLVRNAYGTEAQNVTHPAGSPIPKLDGSVLKVPFDQARIGSTIYLKFVPFNVWAGAGNPRRHAGLYLQTHRLRSHHSASGREERPHLIRRRLQKIWWDDIADFRTGIRYIVKKGVTFNGAQTLGDVAHPPFVAFGDGTYWVQAYCQPVAALLVYSEFPASMTIAGSMLTENIISTIDFRAGGWTGTFEQVSRRGLIRPRC